MQLKILIAEMKIWLSDLVIFSEQCSDTSFFWQDSGFGERQPMQINFSWGFQIREYNKYQIG
jgi:hypothetical protein